MLWSFVSVSSNMIFLIWNEDRKKNLNGVRALNALNSDWIVSANGIKRRAQNWRINARWVYAERMVRECKKWGTRKCFKGYVDCSWILANKFLGSCNENTFDLIHIFFLDDPILRFSASTWNSRGWFSSLKFMINCKPVKWIGIPSFLTLYL